MHKNAMHCKFKTPFDMDTFGDIAIIKYNTNPPKMKM